jgi:hypothetical protein
LLAAINNHQLGHERESFEGQSRRNGHAAGARFPKLFVARFLPIIADFRTATIWGLPQRMPVLNSGFFRAR